MVESPWQLVFSGQAKIDAKKIASAGLRVKVESLFEILRRDPRQNPPPFEKLVGDLAGAFSRRINIQHRLVYEVLDEERIVKVLRMWTHYSYPRLHRATGRETRPAAV